MNTAPEDITSAMPDDGAVPPTSGDRTGAPRAKAGASLPFDPWRLAAAVRLRWRVILGAGAVLGVLAGAGGRFLLTTEYKAGAQLMRQESSASFRASELGEPFRPRQMSVPTLVNFMRSPAVLRRVAEQTQMSSRAIARGMTVTPERNTDLISLSFSSTRSGETAVRVLNAFGTEVVRLTREMQSQEAAEMNRILKRQLAKAEEDLRAMNGEVLEFSRQAGLVHVDKEIDAYLRTLGDLDMRFETARIDLETVDLKIAALEKELSANNPMVERVQAAKEKLTDLLQIYTRANPLVEEQQAIVADLEVRLKETADQPIAAPRQGESGLASGFYAELLNLRTQKEVTTAQLEKLRAVRASIDEKLRGLPEKGMQLARIKARQQSLEAALSLLASRQREAQLYEENAFGYYRFFESRPDQVDVFGRGKKLFLLAAAAGIAGVLLAIAVVCLVETLDDRIKTGADLVRVSGLPLLATLPGLDALDGAARWDWSFRTWLSLRAKLVAGGRPETVCGFVSAGRYEGVSTWLDLLAKASGRRNEAVVVATNRAPDDAGSIPLESALDTPASVDIGPGRVRWLVAPPDWRWDADRRRRWRSAIDRWSRTPGLVVLLELSAAEDPETLLLAEEIPQLIWLAGSGVARTRDTKERLQNFRNAGCRFVGAVLNRETRSFPWS